MRKSPRQRRLEADYRSVEKLNADSSIFSFQAKGDPPNRYRLQFDGPGIYRDTRGKIQISKRHEVIVELGASYPRMVPNLLWQTPIFHPNISNNGVVCLGGYGTHWVPSLTLDEMSTMLWDMIRYENFDIQSPYNREAALWARDQKHFDFPLDQRDVRDLVVNPQAKSAPFQTSSSKVAPSKAEKGVFGMIGAIANRIRDRRERSETSSEPVVAVADEDVEVIHLNDSLPTSDTSRSEHVSQATVIDSPQAADASEVHVIPVEVVEVVEPIESKSDAAESATELVDPSEIEVIEDGIVFLDSHDSNGNLDRAATARSRPILADDNDTGIVFLD